MNRFQRRQAKRLAQKADAEKQAQSLVIAAGNVPSAWALIEREWMKRPPFLLGYQAASLRERGEALYFARESFTVLY